MGKKQAHILIVDDELNFLRSLRDALSLEGFRVSTAETGANALQILDRKKIDVVISDIRMPGMSGLELLSVIKEKYPDLAVFMLTGYGSIEDAVKCVKLGAENYILKPIDVKDLLFHLSSVVERRGNQQKTAGERDLVGQSPALRKVRDLVSKVATSDLPVLVTGESGTGKELVAEMLYRQSKRSQKPFIKINCAALPEHLLESELFGYEAGAFTDARRQKPGKLELADGGTIFLDEIADMPVPMQAKLLRVLEEKKLVRLGGTETIDTDFRIISATNRNIRELLAEKNFRADLFYRINAVEIKLPPLREIPEDIPLLADHFCREYAFQNGHPVPEISAEVISCLQKYHWPGNVRELRNVILRAIVLSQNKPIRIDHLPESLIGSSHSQQPLSLEEVEKDHILRVLKLTNGNKSRTAKLLHIHRDTLYRKLKRHGIE